MEVNSLMQKESQPIFKFRMRIEGKKQDEEEIAVEIVQNLNGKTPK